MKAINYKIHTGLKAKIIRYLRRVSTLGGLFPVNKRYYQLIEKLDNDTLMQDLLSEAYQEVTAHTLEVHKHLITNNDQFNKATFKQVVVELELAKPGEADKLLRRLEETIFLKKKELFSIIKAEDNRMVSAFYFSIFIEILMLGLMTVTRSLPIILVSIFISFFPLFHAFFIKGYSSKFSDSVNNDSFNKF